MKDAIASLIVIGVVMMWAPAWSITPPESGAVAKPAGFQISLPFEDGERVKIIAGYGPHAGSSLHTGTNGTSSANDYHALDFTLPDHPNHGKGQPVLAIADAEVVKAGWGTVGWAAYGQRVILRHTYNGATYHSLYAHLDSIAVAVGDIIEQGTQIGTLGGSCNGASSCNNFSTPHLHFALHEDSNVGGSGTGGSYGGYAVVPEVMDGQGDFERDDILQSQNDGSGQVVDPCLVETGETEIIDELGPCFERVTSYWWDETGGYDDHWYYTKAIDAQQSDTQGTWRFSVEAGGDYTVEVYIPSGAESRQAKYHIGVAGSERAAISVDQASVTGWHVLDTVNLGRGAEHHLRLPDNTGEPLSQEIKIAFDAIRISPATDTGSDAGQPDAGSDAGSHDAGTADTGSGRPDAGEGDASTDDAAQNGGDTGGQRDSGGGDASDDPADSGAVADSSAGGTVTSGTGSCASVGHGAASPVWFLLGFALLAVCRSRR